ncbi:MAG: hypothetical protein RL385_2384 [Pseudomonadota bacterium]|jgi:hypothetical protein
MKHRVAFCLSLAALIACTEDAPAPSRPRPRSGSGGSTGYTAGVGSANSSATSGDAGLTYCTGEAIVDAVSFTQLTRFENTPEQAFGALAGRCTATLHFDAGKFSDGRISFTAPEVSVSVSLSLDERSAREVNPENRDKAGYCPASLAMDADLQVSTADGQLDLHARPTLVYGADHGVQPISFDIRPSDLEGLVRINALPSETVSVHVELDGAGPACTGEIRLELARTDIEKDAGTTAEGSSAAIGTWSTSGCPLGQKAFSMSSVRGMGLAERIAQAWKMASFPGTWDDAQTTDLELAVSLTNATACIDGQGAVSIPVRVRYGTTDARIATHEVAASVRAPSTASNDPLTLNLSDEMLCTSTNTVLPVTLVSCIEVTGATVQLTLKDQTDAEASQRALLIYRTRRKSGETLQPRKLTLQ